MIINNHSLEQWIKDQRTGLINTTFILGTVLYVWYSQHGWLYHRHLYYINMWRHMTTENNAKNNENVRFKSVNLKNTTNKTIIILVGPLLVAGPGPCPLTPLNSALIINK